VLGRPCYAKFMVVPYYTYLKLKMSGPNGVITFGPTYRHAYECDVECVEYAEALAESEAPSSNASGISASAATGGSTAGTATTSAEAGAGTGNASGGHEAAAAPTTTLGTMAASTEEPASGARPTVTCAAWAPRSEASSKKASWPARPGAALAAEADAVLRTFRGARPVEPCLRLLGRIGRARSGHTKEEPGRRCPKILTHSGP
jgi:hypothetical protein